MNSWQKIKLKIISSVNRIRLNFQLEKTPKFFVSSYTKKLNLFLRGRKEFLQQSVCLPRSMCLTIPFMLFSSVLVYGYLSLLSKKRFLSITVFSLCHC